MKNIKNKKYVELFNMILERIKIILKFLLIVIIIKKLYFLSLLNHLQKPIYLK